MIVIFSPISFSVADNVPATLGSSNTLINLVPAVTTLPALSNTYTYKFISQADENDFSNTFSKI